MIKLSVVIITYNEEKNIARCLDSVMTIADEIIIVDSYSTDNTIPIAEKYNARIFKQEFLGYKAQKNFANLKASHDFILSLDADEVLSEELTHSIMEHKSNWNADGYYMNRLNNYCGHWVKYGGWYPDRKLRLYDRTKGSWENDVLHEAFVIKTKVGYLKGDLLHYTFPTIESHDKQIELFTDIAANGMHKAGKRVIFLKKYWSAAYKFIYCYIIRLGFLDGKFGWLIASKSALANFKKYNKLENLYREKGRL
jgi:glycosyltransferase involved in cell wall biosynthesis